MICFSGLSTGWRGREMIRHACAHTLWPGGPDRSRFSCPIGAEEDTMGRKLDALVALALGLAAGGAHAQAAWKPDRPVELIAMNAPGGGSDRTLRIMAKILHEGRHVGVPL